MESAHYTSSHRTYTSGPADESVREMEQIRHTNDTLQKDAPTSGSATYRAQTEESNFRIVTPHYKTADKPDAELKMGVNPEELSSRFAATNGDYKAERSQEHFRMQIIDPKVQSHAHIPAHAVNIEQRRRLIEDFPSLHEKRSLLNLDKMDQLKIRSLEKRPITTSTYLSESMDRHREMEASKLRQYLKAREDEANKPWKKADWPGHKGDESLAKLEELRKSIETLQKATSESKKHDDLDELARLNRELAERSRSRRADWKGVDSQIIKTETEPLPRPPPKQETDNSRYSTLSRELDDLAREEYTESYSRSARGSFNRYASMPALDTSASRGTLIRLEDERPRSIMKRKELESREQILAPAHSVYEVREVIKPSAQTTVQKKEQTKRTEEITRRVLRRERKHKSHRTRYGYSGGGAEAIEWHGGGGGYRSSSASRHGAGYQNGHGGYDAGYGSYSRSASSRREGSAFGDRYYEPNGEYRELREFRNGYGGEAGGARRMHKSYSTKDVFNGGRHEDDGYSSFSRRGQPFIEFPPTLPRHRNEPPAPPPHGRRESDAFHRRESDSFYRPIQKSRSYADWDDVERRGPFGAPVRRHDDEMARLENEFRDARLLNIPNGNFHEKDFRHENIPGGYETYERETKAHSERRQKGGSNADLAGFKHEDSNEQSFRREQVR